jgi:uncharacterized protein
VPSGCTSSSRPIPDSTRGGEPLLRAILIALVVVAAVALLMWALQRRLIYLPTQVTPAVEAVLAGAEEVTFTTADDLELAGWFVPADGERRDTAVLVTNGNGGNRALRGPLASRLADEGFDVLLFDYRGYGGNPGSPSEEGLHADAVAAYRYLGDRPEVDPARVILLGESLGAAVAVGLAADDAVPPPAGLVLRSPFTSLVDVARHHYPFLPVRWLLWDRYPSEERIGALEVPLVVVAGDADAIVPVEQSERLHELASEPKWLVTVPGADHNDPELGHGDELVRAVVELTEFAVGSG